MVAEFELTPQEIVKELDKYIVGQFEAKKCVAIALRNRYRRRQLPPKIQEDIMPKNIIMIGPTGVGKTEIARRLARLVKAPFIKVEATKFTEVGYVGRDVDSIIRDLVDIAVRMVKEEKMEQYAKKAEKLAEERIIDLLLPLPQKRKATATNPFNIFFPSSKLGSEGEENNADYNEQQQERIERIKSGRELLRAKLKAGEIENKIVELEVDDSLPPMAEIFSGYGMEEMSINFQDILGSLIPKKKKKKKIPISQARKIIKQQEAEKLIDRDEVVSEAITRTEQLGIVFIDEIDKIVGSGSQGTIDVSREGVQRDILPIVEGSTVVTKYGPVKTDHILFIAAGAFNVSKPSDLIPELQGRFPVRVELSSLKEEHFKQILTEPENALIKQYKLLLSVEEVELEFTSSGIDEIARISCQLNEELEDIGARRLHTILEKLLEDISFTGPEKKQKHIVIDRDYVIQKLQNIVRNKDLSKYIL